MRFRLGLTAVLLLIALVASKPHAGTLYRWVDENGVTHVSDQNPGGQANAPDDVQEVRDPEPTKANQKAPMPAPPPPGRGSYYKPKRWNREPAPAPPQVSGEASRQSDSALPTISAADNADRRTVKTAENKICGFPGMKVPADAMIYAAGGSANEAKRLGFQIDQSGNDAKQVDVLVNEPRRPVVLLLSAHEPIVWNISWSPSSKILAVAAVGGNRQAVAGLPKSVPLLVSSQRDSAPPCEGLSVAPPWASEIEKVDNQKSLDRVAKKLYGRSVDQVRYIDKTRVIIGEPPATGLAMQTSPDTPPKSFYDPGAPLVAKAALKDAVKKGILREATTRDMEQWNQEYAKANPRRMVYADDEKPSRPSRPGKLFETYAVLKPCTFPPGLYGGDSATFIVLKGVPYPEGNPGHSTVYDINTANCHGSFCPQGYQTAAVTQKPSTPKEKSSERTTPRERECKYGCCFLDLQLPENAAVYAAGAVASDGWPLGFQIDQSGEDAKRIDVMVNEPDKPVALLLSSYGPTVWNISWSPRTKLLAVAAVGHRGQALAGLPKSIPQLISCNDTGKVRCGTVYILPPGAPEAAKAKSVRETDELTLRLFDREADGVFPITSATALVGKPLKAGTKMVSSPETTPESFFNPAAPLAGEAGLKDALQKGLLRKATYQDVKDWNDQYAKAHGKRDVFPKDTGQPAPSLQKEYGRAYIVLKPFAFPKGLYGGRSATFYVPQGVPYPTGDPGHSCVYDFRTLSRKGGC
jgi:hypothetical protein